MDPVAAALEVLRRARRRAADDTALTPDPDGDDARVPPFPADVGVFICLAMARSCSAHPTRALSFAGSAWLCAVQLPPDHTLHVDVHCALAAGAYHLGRHALAASLFARALEALANRGVCEPMEVGECYNNLACCAASVGSAAGEALLRKCHAMLVRELRPSHPALNTVMRNLGRQISMPVRLPAPDPYRAAYMAGARPPIAAPHFFIPAPKAAAKKGAKKGGAKKGGKKGKKKK